MKIVKGQYNEAKIFTDIVDEGALKQIQAMCDSPVFERSKIRIMPDVHSGAGCTIGTTMTIFDKAVPNMVGVDIGCGMELVRLKQRSLDLAALDALIYEKIPSGFDVRKTRHAYTEQIDLNELRCADKVNLYRAYLSLGSLGGGNHFIEADRDDDGNLYIVVHSGSRHLGTEVAQYYQNEGYRTLCGNSAKQIDEIVRSLKDAGREKDIQSAIETAKKQICDVPLDAAYVEGELFDDYIHDMKIVQQFAMLNRQAMMDEILRGLGLSVVEQFTTVHNYIDTDRMILRKGAVSARMGEKLIIPINMRDGSLICVGKGNGDWNQSAPHGAGRLMSRSKAYHTLSLEEFQKQMKGIYSTSVNMNTIDESPMAYKNVEDIEGNIKPTVDIVKRIKPIYNFKASEDVAFGKKKK